MNKKVVLLFLVATSTILASSDKNEDTLELGLKGKEHGAGEESCFTQLYKCYVAAAQSMLFKLPPKITGSVSKKKD